MKNLVVRLVAFIPVIAMIVPLAAHAQYGGGGGMPPIGISPIIFLPFHFPVIHFPVITFPPFHFSTIHFPFFTL
jgi:hypothetical protein